ncbi:MAG: hypothetical protein Q7T86_19455 [Hyphomicrobiaceae bacterium]|nr:hypothetical protein [Hyphomicrobiaceae bacterium]
MTPGATTVIDVNNENFANGGCVYVKVQTGTMASVLNGVQATITTRSPTQITVSANTTGLTFGGGDNWVMSCTLWKLLDESIAKSISPGAPAYPNQYSYFTQQQTLALLNGSATGAYGTLYCTDKTCGSLFAPNLAEHQLVAGSYGLNLSTYEMGNGAVLNATLFNSPPQAIVDAISAANTDFGVIGDTSCGGLPCNMARQNEWAYQKFSEAYGSFPSQFVDAGPPSKYGPWTSMRCITVDCSLNPKWTSVVAQNALGPFVPSYPAAPGAGSYAYLPPTSTNANYHNGGSWSYNVTTGTAAGNASICVATNRSAAITSVALGGVTASVPDVVDTASGSVIAIYHLAYGAGASTRQVDINISGTDDGDRAAFVYSLPNASGLTVVGTSPGTNNSATLNVTKGSAAITCGWQISATPSASWKAGTNNRIAPITNNNAPGVGTSALFQANFTSPIFGMVTDSGQATIVVAAGYR